MHNNQSYLIALCEQICAQGLKPSLALIRGQSTRPLPIPEVIKFLHNWKQAPQKVGLSGSPTEHKAEPDSELDLQSRVAYLEKQVAQLQQQLATLLPQQPLSDKEV
jgi:DNA-binding transcriptional MerR regulator